MADRRSQPRTHRRRRFTLLLAFYVLFCGLAASVVIFAALRYRDMIVSVIDESDGTTRDASPIGKVSDNDSAAPGRDEVDRLADDFEETAASVEGDDAAIFSAAGAMLRSFQESQTRYSAAAKRVNDAGWGAATRLGSLAAIDRRMEMIRSLAKENESFAALMREIPKQFRERLTKAGVAGPKIGLALVRHVPQKKTELVLKIREQDRLLCDAWLDALQLLRDQWGRWRLDAEAGTVRFESDSAAGAHAALMDRIRAIQERQIQLQKKLRGG